MQISRPGHQLDGGDAAHRLSIPSGDRISQDLAPGGQFSTASGDVGAHRLCPSHQVSGIISLILTGSGNVPRSSITTSYLSQWSSLFPLTIRFHHLCLGIRRHILTCLNFRYNLLWCGTPWQFPTPKLLYLCFRLNSSNIHSPHALTI